MHARPIAIWVLSFLALVLPASSADSFCPNLKQRTGDCLICDDIRVFEIQNGRPTDCEAIGHTSVPAKAIQSTCKGVICKLSSWSMYSWVDTRGNKCVQSIDMPGPTGITLYVCGVSSTPAMTPAPVPTPIPETPIPKTASPKTPIPKTPIPETPIPDTPTPPIPVTLMPAIPTTPTPVFPATPTPPIPVTPTPAVPATPTPAMSTTPTPAAATPVPDKLTPSPNATANETPMPMAIAETPEPMATPTPQESLALYAACNGTLDTRCVEGSTCRPPAVQGGAPGFWCVEDTANLYSCKWDEATVRPWLWNQQLYCCTTKGVRCPTAREIATGKSAKACTSAEGKTEVEVKQCCQETGLLCTGVYTSTPSCNANQMGLTSQQKETCCQQDNTHCATDCSSAVSANDKLYCCDVKGLYCAGLDTFTEREKQKQAELAKLSTYQTVRNFSMKIEGLPHEPIKDPKKFMGRVRLALVATSDHLRVDPSILLMTRMGVLLASGDIPPSDMSNWSIDAPAEWQVSSVFAAEKASIAQYLKMMSPGRGADVLGGTADNVIGLFVEYSLRDTSATVVNEAEAHILQAHNVAKETKSGFRGPMKTVYPLGPPTVLAGPPVAKDETPKDNHNWVIPALAGLAGLVLCAGVVFAVANKKRRAVISDDQKPLYIGDYEPPILQEMNELDLGYSDTDPNLLGYNHATQTGQTHSQHHVIESGEL